MCNSDRVIGRDSNDQIMKTMIVEKNIFFLANWLKQHFGRHPELRLFSLPQHAVQTLDLWTPKYRCEKREIHGFESYVVMSGLATYLINLI